MAIVLFGVRIREQADRIRDAVSVPPGAWSSRTCRDLAALI
jgi:hypothetical protein